MIQIWHLVVGGVITIAGSWLTVWVTGKTSVTVAEVNAETGAYGRAETIYNNANARLDKENGVLRDDLQKERQAREELSKKYDSLLEKFNDLVGEMGRLKDRLARDGIDIGDITDRPQLPEGK